MPLQTARQEHLTRPVTPIGSLERGIDILLALSAAPRPISLAQLSRSTGLPKSTAHRILGVLCARELARRVGTGYLPGLQLETMAGIARNRIPGSRRVVLPYLLCLQETTRQTVNLAVPAGLEARYVERLYGHDRVRSRSDGTDLAPLHCTATGKALLAFDSGLREEVLGQGGFERLTSRTITGVATLERELAQVRRYGVAYAQEEYTEGVSCVAAPVFGPGGGVCMSVGWRRPARPRRWPGWASPYAARRRRSRPRWWWPEVFRLLERSTERGPKTFRPARPPLARLADGRSHDPMNFLPVPAPEEAPTARPSQPRTTPSTQRPTGDEKTRDTRTPTGDGKTRTPQGKSTPAGEGEA
ncbi:IclR family transcriptional regulator, partial [Nonomuraea sp. NPDC001023]